MKGAPQRSLLAQIAWIGQQCRDGLQTCLYHLARLVEEDLPHLGIVIVHWRRSRRRNLNCRNAHWQRGLHGCWCSRRERLGSRCRGIHREPIISFVVGRLVTPHDRPQFTNSLVVDKQFLRQRPLVTQHVDQEAKRTQAVAQLLEYPGTGRGALVELVHQEFLDAVTHAQCRQGRLVQAEHGKHAAHLRQLARHFMQWYTVLRTAEELIQRLFDLPQGVAQFIHHAAHGLAITDTPVQILHPRFHRLRMGAGGDIFEPLRKTLAALGHLGLGRVQVFVGGLEVQHRCRHLHRDRRRRWLTRTCRGLHRTRQCARQIRALGMQFEHRLGDCTELVGSGLHAIRVTAGQSGPGLCCRRDAFTRLRQHGRVKPAKLRRRIVERSAVRESIGLAHRHQGRRLGANPRHRQCTIKQQVLRQPINHGGITAGQAGVLANDARRGTFYIHVRRTQTKTQGFKKSRAEFPEHPRLELLRMRRQPQADLHHGAGGLLVQRAHHPQHGLVNPGAHRRVVGQGRRRTIGRHIDPAPFVGPQVRRMYTVTTDQLNHVAVLHEKRHR